MRFLPALEAPWRRCAICLLSLLPGLSAFGQMNTGEIGGSVQDPSGATIPGAMIVARHEGTGQQLGAVSNSAGEYLFAQVPVGVYSLTVNAANFKQSTLPRVEVHAAGRLRQDFTLQLGDSREVVTVEVDSEVQL